MNHFTRGYRMQKSLLFKMSALLLAFLLLLSPLAPVFAEEQVSSSDTTPATQVIISDTSTQDTTSLNVDPASSPTDMVVQTAPDSQAPTAAPAKNPSKSLTPKNVSVSAMAGTGTSDPANPSTWSNTSISKTIKPTIDQTTGALTYSYPIGALSGVNGQNPNLSLIYNSQNSDQDSIFGYGWSSNIPYIQRVNKHGTDQLYTGTYNDFSSSQFGELVSKTATAYVPKSASDIVSLTFSSNVWSYTDKSGNVYTFGSAAASRQDDPNNASNIFKWMLSSVTDVNGNTITYTYTKDQGQIYPDTITYGGIYSIQFIKGARADALTSYKASFVEKTNYRITQISISTNAAWSKKYDLGYVAGDNGVRSMLYTITESARDNVGNITTLPVQQMSYSQATPWWPGAQTAADVGSYSYAKYTGSVGNAQLHGGASLLLDLNGDSYPDILYGYVNGYTVINGSWLNDTHDLVASNPGGSAYYYYNDPFNISTPALGLPNSGTFTALEFRNGQGAYPSEGYLVGDLNGDLLPDIMQNINAYTFNQYSYPAAVGSYLNIGGSSYGADNTAWRTAVPIEDRYQNNPNGNNYAHTYLLDINGDTLPDFINDNNGATNAQLNQGTGFGTNNSSPLPAIPATFYNYPNVTNYLDINGDGLVDYLKLDVGFTNNSAFINTGNLTWIEDSTLKSPLREPGCFGCNASTFMYVDINGDGLPDIVPNSVTAQNQLGPADENFMTYINTGTGWAPSYSWSLPMNGAARTADLNQDGLPDFMSNSSLGYDVAMSSGTVSDLLQTVTFSTGGTTSITYKPSTQYKDGSGNTLNPQLPFIVQTVNTITTTDPITNTSATTTYTYSGGSYYYNGPFDRKFAGFEKVTTTRPDGSSVINYYHQGNTTNSGTYEYSDNVGKMGFIYRTDTLDGTGTLVSRSTTKYSSSNPTSGAYFVYPTQTINEIAGANTATTYTFNTTTGNLSSQVDYGQVTVTDPLTFTDTGTDKKTTNYTYATNGTGTYKPSDVTTLNQSSAKVFENRYYYDTLALGTLTKGNNTKTEQWKTSTTYANRQKTYDSYGNVLTSTDARSKVTTYVYDPNHLYVATMTDPLTHVTSYVNDYNTGKTIQVTYPTTFVYQTSYDGFGRPLEQKIPDPTGAAGLVTKTTYVYTDTPNATSTKVTQYLDGTNTVDSYTYVDGLGRVLQDRAENESGTYNTKDYAYDTMGRVQKQSLPYVSSGTARTTPTTTAALYTNFTYDTLGRILTSQDAIGTTTNVYTGFKTTVTDPRGKIKSYYKDAYGNLVQVDEKNGAATYTTTYAWNLNNMLTNITDALGNVRNFTYNGLNQRLTAEDLHTVGDAPYGSWAYTYDNENNLTQSISPQGNTVNYTYDNAGRIKTEDYTGVTGTEITYVYDTCTNGSGSLCSVTMLAGTGANTSYTYDQDGNIAKETKTINGTAYVTQYTYDRQTNQLIVTYPDSSQVRYTYNTGGLLNQIETKESAGTFANVVSNIDYSPINQPTTISYVNGTTTTNTYDAAHSYRLSNKKTTNGVPVNLQNIAYTYDADNNITKIIDSSATDASKTVNYTYDDLNRMLTATATAVATGQSTYTQTYMYNAIGDITSGPVGAYVYNGNIGLNYANPHAATSINGVANTYDADGNVLTDGTLTNTWNYKDLLSTSTNGTFTRTYLYDQGGNRVSSANGTVTTVYPNKYYTYDGTTKTKDIYMGNTLVATITKAGTTVTPYYVHADNVLGSNVLSDSTGAKNQLLDYFPYGQNRINQQVTTFNEQKQYGGHYFDSDTTLTYFGARYHDGRRGQFISQDPSFVALGDEQQIKKMTGMKLNDVLMDPQSLNSYSYGRDNPITNVDPNGRFAIIDDVIIGGLIYLFIPNTLQADPVYEPEQYAYTSQYHPQVFFGGDMEMTPGEGIPFEESSIFNNRQVTTPKIKAQGSPITNGSGEVLYRGGNNLDESGLRFDKNGNIKSGYSLNTDPNSPNILNNGGAHTLDNLPDGLKVVKTGNQETSTHYEIKPVDPTMSKSQYLEATKSIKLTPKQ